MAPKQKELWLACGKAFGKDYAIQCVICGLWIHLKPCSGMTDEFFKYLEEQIKATGSAYWACRPCLSYSQAITQKVKVIEKDIETLKGDVKDNKAGVRNVENTIEEMRRQMEKDKKELEQKIDDCRLEMREEWREREIRRKNLVFHRIEEPSDSIVIGEERRKHDMEQLKMVFQTIGLAGMEDDVKACRRLGEKGDNDRPIIVVLKSEDSKRKILEEARKLKDTDFADVGIVPDLTSEQRREEAEMMEETERRNQTMRSEDDVAKNLKWMVVGPRGERRLIKGSERGRGNLRGATRGTRGHQARGGRTSYQRQHRPSQHRMEEPRLLPPSQNRKRTITEVEVEMEEDQEATASQNPPAKC